MKALLLSLGLLSLPLTLGAQTPKACTTQLQQDFALKQHSFPRGGFFDIFLGRARCTDVPLRLYALQ